MARPTSREPENAPGLDAFLNPHSMVTPGLLGSAVTLGANSLGQLQLAPLLWIYLALSFAFGVTAIINSGSLIQKGLFYFLNSIIIFSVALGANKIGMETAKQAQLNVVSTAYASTETGSVSIQLVQFFQEVFPARSTRYTRTSCGSILDASTGLDWLVGPDKNMTWAEAKEWIANQKTCGEGWKAPTIPQLAALYDRRYTAGTGWYERGQHWPAHMNPIFAGIGSGSWVWADSPRNAEQVAAYNFNQGVETRLPASGFYGSVRVFAVRATN